MTIATLILFALACMGLTLIIVDSDILKPVREIIKSKSAFFGEMITCPQCSGFWVGLLLGTYMVNLLNDSSWNFMDVPLVFMFSFASSYLSMLGKAMLVYLNFYATFPLDMGTNDQTSEPLRN